MDYIKTQITQKYPGLEKSLSDKESARSIDEFLRNEDSNSLFVYLTYSSDSHSRNHSKSGQLNFTNNINSIPNLGTSNFNNLALCFLKNDRSKEVKGSEGDHPGSRGQLPKGSDGLVCLPVNNEVMDLVIKNIYSPKYPELEGVFNGLRLGLGRRQ